MYWLDKDRNKVICYEFSKDNYDWNNGKKYLCSTFISYTNKSIIIPEIDLSGYDANFIQGTIPGISTLYFDDSSDFPRTRLCVSDFKRCIKLSKANFIVVKDKVTHNNMETHHIFIDNSGIYYAISDLNYSTLFGSSFDVMKNALSVSDPAIYSWTHVYSGKLTTIDTNDCENLFKYLNGEYTMPFITDKQLFDQINSSLQEPTIDDMLSLWDMLKSTDKSIVKLGVDMVAGFNLTKYRLSFRLLLAGCSSDRRTCWSLSYYGGNSVTAKMLKEMMGISGCWPTYWLMNNLQESDIVYDNDDIQLSQELFNVKYPEYEASLKANPNDYWKDLKFIPDVWKS